MLKILALLTLAQYPNMVGRPMGPGTGTGSGGCPNCIVDDGGYDVVGAYLPLDGGTVYGSVGIQRSLRAQNLDAGPALFVDSPQINGTATWILAQRGSSQPVLCANNGTTSLDIYTNAQFSGMGYRTGMAADSCAAATRVSLWEYNWLAGTTSPIYSPKPYQILGNTDAGIISCAATLNGTIEWRTSLGCLGYCGRDNQWHCVGPDFTVAGEATLSSGTVTVNFPQAFATAPFCTCSTIGATPLICGLSAAASTTSVTFVAVTGGTETINFSCTGRK